mgnify:CR=1 FL=1
MTLPTNTNFSLLNDEYNKLSDENLLDYMRKLSEEIEISYQNIAINFNGFNKTSFLDNTGVLNRQENWTPTLNGTTTQDTFTYPLDEQIGWAYKQGLVNDIWFDITWTGSGGAAGNLYVELPYKVANIPGKPFLGSIQSSMITFATGTYMVCNVDFWNRYLNR